MKTMDKKYYEEMKKKAVVILDQQAEGTSAREIMARIYVEGLQDKTIDQGLMMADQALEAIVDFNKAYAEAVDQKDEPLERMLDEMLEGKTLMERCNILSALYAGAEAANAKMAGEDEAACDEILMEADADPITEAEATEALAAELRDQVLKTFRSTAILSRGMIRQADQLDALIAEAGISQMVIQMGENEAEYEGILTMIAYVESKTTDVKELPPDLSIEETACIVAATVEEEQIIQQYAAGELAMNVAVVLLDILGVVLLLKLASKLMLLGMAIATNLCGIIIAIPAAIFMGLAIIGILGEAIKFWDGGVRTTVKFAATAGRMGSRTASGTMRKIGEFVYSTVAPIAAGIVDRVKNYYEAVKTENHNALTVENRI